MSKLSVVIPAWNEQEGIGPVIRRILEIGRARWAKAGVSELEILVVDDGSTDGTAQAVMRAATGARQHGACVRLVRHDTNCGYGAALQTGFAKATGDLLAFLDADSTYPPESLPALCQALRASGPALIIGNRMSQPFSGMPALRWLGNVFFARLAGLLAGVPVADCSSGMRVLPAAVWDELRPLPAGLDFTPAMTMRALHQGLVLKEVSIPYHERIGRSKLNIVRDGCRFLITILRETWTYRRYRFCAMMALAAALFILSLMGIRLAVVMLQSFNPYGTIAAVVTLLTWLLLANLASMRTRFAISRLNWHGFLQSKRRPSGGEEYAPR